MPTGPSGTSSAALVVKIPAPAAAGHAVRPSYISPSTQSLAVSVGGESSTVVANLTPSSPGCVPATGSTPLTCTVTVTAPVGSDTFTVTMYDGLNASGNVLSKGSVTANVSANQTTPIHVVTNGTVCAISVTLGNPSPPQGTAATIPVTVAVYDAAGNVIIAPGSYSAPIALSDSDSKYTTLSTATVTAPGQPVTLAYTGGPLATATISASSPGIPAGKITNAVLTPSGGAAIAAIKLTVASASLTPRTPSSTNLTVTALNASGGVISGTYPSPIALSTTNAALTLNPKTVTASGQPVTVTYSGSTLVYGNVSVTASAPGVPPAGVTAAAFAPKTPCLPTFTHKNLYVMWDTASVQDVYRYAPPYTGAPTALNTITYGVYMTIDPLGRIFVAQANTSGYPGPSANVVYMSPPYATAPVAVTPANLSIYGTALDDKGDLFVAQVNGPILSAPGPVPATGFYATPAALPNSPTGVYSLAVDNYCNVIAGGANGTIYVLGTTGQPGGGYGQVTPVVNSTLAPAGGVGGTTLDAKGDVFFVVGSQIYELAPPYSKKPTALINIPGAGITSMTIDTSGNLITADYSNNKIEKIAPPYTSYTTIISGVLSNAAAVVIGP